VETARETFKKYHQLNADRFGAESSLLLHDLKIKPSKEMFKEDAKKANAETTAQNAAQQLPALIPAMDKFNSLVMRRLRLGIALLNSPHMDDRIENVSELRASVGRMMPQLLACNRLVRENPANQDEMSRMFIMLNHTENNNTNEKLFKEIEKLQEKIYDKYIGKFRELKDMVYPFSHGKQNAAVTDFVFSGPPKKQHLGELLENSSAYLDKIFYLYCRIFGFIMQAAEKVETSLGLPPLQDPKTEEEEEEKENVN
jgi:hypothetical protein